MTDVSKTKQLYEELILLISKLNNDLNKAKGEEADEIRATRDRAVTCKEVFEDDIKKLKNKEPFSPEDIMAIGKVAGRARALVYNYKYKIKT